MLIASSWVDPVPDVRGLDDTQPLTVPRGHRAHAPAGSHIEVHGCTDAGRQRARNEDQFLVADLTGPRSSATRR